MAWRENTLAVPSAALSCCRKCSASSSASPSRSFKAGSEMGNTASRYIRSSRSCPSCTARCGSRLVAAMHPDVRAQFGLAADTGKPAGLEDTQQPNLHFGRHFGNFVQEQRAVLCPLEASAMQPRSSGEGALLVAEQLRLDQVGRNGAAIDGHEWRMCILAAIMDRACDELLAAPGFPGDEHRCRRGRNLLDPAIDFLHGRRTAEQVSEPTRSRARTPPGRPRQMAGSRCCWSCRRCTCLASWWPGG